QEQKFEILGLEQNFVWNINNFLIRGTIDRIDKLNKEEVSIIDYKTGHKVDVNKYSFSMNIYAAAVEEVFGLKVKNMYLVYPLLDREVEIKRDDKIKDDILGILDSIKNRRFDTINKNNCAQCYCKNFCKK
ncbi:PD-(D/E)XK nuclease family protein, partial [bacterium]